MDNMEGRWTFNETEDGSWCHDDFETMEEAIEAAKEYFCSDQEIMYIARCEIVPFPTYVDVDDIFDQLNEHYGEECFEYDDFLFDDVKKEDQEWLERKLQDLMLEFYERTGIKSTQFTMAEVKEITWR